MNYKRFRCFFAWENLIIPALLIFSVALIAALLWAAAEENKEWEEFKDAHQCKIIAKIRGDVFNTYGIDSKGNMTIGVGATPDKTGWLCDDGMTYYR